MPKKLTTEDLARMVKHGFDEVYTRFDQTATKDDLKQFATKEDFRALEQKMDDGFHAVNRRIDLLHEDISDPPDIREEVKDLGERLTRVERKVGVAH